MSNTILVTGLDGSGKSTFFSKLREIKKPAFALLNLPKIDVNVFADNIDLYRTGRFINTLSDIADEKQQSFIKGLTLFASMVFFRDLHNHLVGKRVKTIFCERHPLIDAPVYAQFYAPRMNPDALDNEVLHLLDRSFSDQFMLVLAKVGKDKRLTHTSISGSICQFIYTHFHVKQQETYRRLPQIFNVTVPDSIYYLEARPDVLMNRILKRHKSQPHETKSILSAFRDAYEKVFLDVQKIGSCQVTRVDASDFKKLDVFFEMIKDEV
ncbi:MAG: hypothetical protein AAF600_17705 [Bacteroidota bacterium]